MSEISVDVAVVGGSFGGVAAALAAARYGKSVALIERSRTVGGQATSQGVTRWDERASATTPQTYGTTKSYRDLKLAVRHWYADRNVLAHGVDPDTFNPGFRGDGHPFAADPAVVEFVLSGLLRTAGVNVMLEHSVRSVNVEGGAIRSLLLDNGDVIDATVVVDATDLGDLLPAAGVNWVIGTEARGDTEEPHAPDAAAPGHIQAITVPVAVERRAGNAPIVPEPPIDPAIVAQQKFRVSDGDIGGVFTPHGKGKYETVFDYRQYIDHRNFDDPAYATDRTTINVGSNDYMQAVIPTDDAQADAETFRNAGFVSLAYVRWLQTAVPHDEGTGTGYPNIGIRPDAFTETTDGTAPQPYIRESRRLARPMTRVCEQHIAVARDNDPAKRAPMNFSDSCGIGDYAADVHAVSGPPQTPQVGGVYTRPFQVPLGSLIPQDCANLIAGCKNIGATHISSSAYRVHPGEWAIGEAAGVFSAYCVGQNVGPHDAFRNPSRVAAIQLRLLEGGAPIFWWSDVPFETNVAEFAAAQLLGVRGYMADPSSLKFRPDDVMTQHERDAVDSHAGRKLPWPSSPMKRGRSAVWICGELGLPSNELVQHWEA